MGCSARDRRISTFDLAPPSESCESATKQAFSPTNLDLAAKDCSKPWKHKPRVDTVSNVLDQPEERVCGAKVVICHYAFCLLLSPATSIPAPSSHKQVSAPDVCGPSPDHLCDVKPERHTPVAEPCCAASALSVQLHGLSVSSGGCYS